MDVSPVANAVSAAILQQTQAATSAAVAALASVASGNAPPPGNPVQYAGGSTQLLDLTA